MPMTHTHMPDLAGATGWARGLCIFNASGITDGTHTVSHTKCNTHTSITVKACGWGMQHCHSMYW